MPFPRPIDATLHGVTDYQVGAVLMTVFPKLAGIEGTESAKQVRAAGAAHAGYSTLTDYPLGLAKLIPYKAHLVIDAVGAVALMATPFVTGQFRKGRKHWLPHIGLGLFELASLALSDPTGRGGRCATPRAVRATRCCWTSSDLADPPYRHRRRGGGGGRRRPGRVAVARTVRGRDRPAVVVGQYPGDERPRRRPRRDGERRRADVQRAAD